MGQLRINIHILNDYTIRISPELRLPRDCNRFNSLFEQLFTDKQIPPSSEKPLMTLRPETLNELKSEVNPSYTVALTSHGKQTKLEDLCTRLNEENNPLVFIGAYPHGPMRNDTLNEVDEAISIHDESLEAWVVTSRLIYEYEKKLITV